MDVFESIVMLAERLGVEAISTLPGCWEVQVDERWWFAVNGHREPIACSKGPTVPPVHVYVEFNGWPAGILSPAGGEFAAGAAANADAFIAALAAHGGAGGQ